MQSSWPHANRRVFILGELKPNVSVHGSMATLNLHSNSIGDVGAKAIAEAVKSSGSMATLDLSENQIGDVGAKAIAEAVKSSGSMATLVLSQNQIGDAGAKAIAEAVKSSGSMALKTLVVPSAIKKHAELVAACKSKGVALV